VNQLVLDEMAEVRDYVNRTLALRAENGIKVRQPLAALSVPRLGSFVDFEEILIEEVNVKSVQQGSELKLDVTLTPTLRREGLMREIIRVVQSARKNAGLNVDDRITLALSSEAAEVTEAISSHTDGIKAETLASHLHVGHKTLAHTAEAMIEGQKLIVSLEKAR
jgi:isoleucyl-tRNA synthetase